MSGGLLLASLLTAHRTPCGLPKCAASRASGVGKLAWFRRAAALERWIGALCLSEGRPFMDLECIQQALHDEKLDAWLFYDFRKLNPIAYQVLTLPTEDLYTRRWFYFIPVQ